MTTIEMAVLGLGLLGIFVIYGFVFYDMYKCFEKGIVNQAEEENTLGLVEEDDE